MNMQDLFARKAHGNVLKIGWILALIVLSAMVLEYIKGGRTLQFTAVGISILISTMSAASIMHWCSFQVSKIKYISFSGMFIVYVMVFWSSKFVMTSVFILPWIIAMSLFYSRRFVYVISVLVVIINTAQVASRVYEGFTDQASMTNYTLQLCIIFTAIAAIIIIMNSSVRFKDESEQNLAKAEKSGKVQSEMLEDVMKIARVMKGNLQAIHETVENISNSSETVYTAVKEIAAGSENNAESLQEQTKLTGEIQSKIKMLSDMTGEMKKSAELTNETAEHGVKTIEKLSQTTSILTRNNQNVFSIMNEFKDRSADIGNIIETMKRIAEQTNLLVQLILY